MVQGVSLTIIWCGSSATDHHSGIWGCARSGGCMTAGGWPPAKFAAGHAPGPRTSYWGWRFGQHSDDSGHPSPEVWTLVGTWWGVGECKTG